MKRINTLSLLVALAVFFYGCEQRDCCSPLAPLDGSLVGEWQLYERGYSPGAGYITEEVPAEPSQTFHFLADGTFSSSIQSMDGYKYYLVLDDPQSDQDILSLYKTDPGNKPQDIYKLEHSYSMVMGEGTLKLHYRWCIEGCHLGLRHLTNQ
jgi:hypothetical protein